MAPTLTTIHIAAGTIVFEHRNSPTTKGLVEDRPVTLPTDVYVRASRQDDGSWGYTVGQGRQTRVYSCSGGLAEPVAEWDD